MSRYKLLKTWIKIRGIAYFFFFSFFPILFAVLSTNLLRDIGTKIDLSFLNNLLSDRLVFLVIQYVVFLICFVIFFEKIIKMNKFFSNAENWFIDMGKAFFPSILAFAIGGFVVYIISSAIELLPEPNFLKKWIDEPNYGFVIFLKNLQNASHFRAMFLFVYIIILVPFYEEILFRGFLQDSIEKIFKKYNLDVIVVSLIFSMFHLFSLSNAIFAFVIGLFLSKQRQKNKSINISIWIHCIINFTGLLSGILYQYFERKIVY